MSLVDDVTSAQQGLLEREAPLALLVDLFDEARAGRGRVVLVAGEAGVGKTALVRAFLNRIGEEGSGLIGACDPLFTPRPLGPVVDIARQVGGDLLELVDDGAIPYRIAEELIGQLGTSTVVVLEDVHWADEATLDVFRLVARRVESLPVLIIATYRDDEVDPLHPLRIVLGGLATVPAVRRVSLQPLTPSAVAELAEPYGADADDLYRMTGGNPFFVTEVLAGGADAIPGSVRDAVLARKATLSSGAQTVIEATSVTPTGAEPWLLRALAEPRNGELAECLASGMLSESGGVLRFRHELARLAIEASLATDDRVAYHLRALAALERRGGVVDFARLAHHADAAGDGEAVLRFAPDAGARASSLAAHREAAAQYRRALRYASDLPLRERARLLERYSHECYLTDEADEAVASLQTAVGCYRELGDVRREGATLSSLAGILWCPGRGREGRQVGLRAVELLERIEPSPELARALGLLVFLHERDGDLEASDRWDDRATALSRELDLDLTWPHINAGLREVRAGSMQGVDEVERGIASFREHGRVEDATDATIGLVFTLTHRGPHTIAARWIEDAIAQARSNGLELSHLYGLAHRAKLELDAGRWTEASSSAEIVLGERFVSTFPRTQALVVLALVRARRGDPGVHPLLDEALELALPTGELPRIAPVAAARAEAAWLAGRPDLVAAETDAAYELALERRAPWAIGELAAIRRRAGLRDPIPVDAVEPHASELSGDWRRAARSWTRLGCPYAAALARADSEDVDALRLAYDALRDLDARPAAEIVAQLLRKHGARGVPRGPRRSTRANPGGLTTREMEVLTLVAEGLRNGEIAKRLFVSRRTVDHHVSTVLRKLDAHTRGEAVATARRANLLETSSG